MIYTIVLHIGNISVTKNCIASLEKYEKKTTKILVVNNDTTRLSGKDFGSSNVEVINNKKNLGFAGGVNIGIVHALRKGAEAVFLLNNDTVLHSQGISVLLKDLEINSKIGIIGPAVTFQKDGKKIYDIGGYVNLWLGKTSHKEVEIVKGLDLQYPQYITGAAMCIKKEVFEKIGYFDEKFFLYYEDADFCLRAKENGFLIAVDPRVSVYHLLSKTIGKVNSFAIYHQTKSALIFGNKYFNNFPKGIFQRGFIFYQSIIFLFKSPREGIAAFAAIFE